MSTPNQLQSNRRLARRFLTSGTARVECRKGTMGLGPNLAVSAIDMSEIGIRLLLRTALEKGTEVELLFSGVGLAKPVKSFARVTRCSAQDDGTYQVGFQFERRLRYQELQ